MQYPTIAQPQYGFAPTMPMMPSMSDMPPAMMPTMNFKKGGIASLSLPEMAEKVRAAGRGDDTMLAHITPEEAGILKLLGGSGTINPKTGQPEFLRKFIKKIVPKEIYKPISSLGKELERGVEKVAKELGPVGQIAAAYFGGPIGAALYAGLAPEGSSFDVKRAAIAGALTAGAQQYAQGAGGADSAAGTGGPYDISDVGSLGDLGMDATQSVYSGAPSVVESVSAPAAYGGYDISDISFGDTYPVSAPTPVAAPSGIESLRAPIDYMGEPGAGPSTVTQSMNPATGLPAPPPPPTIGEKIANYGTQIKEGIQSLPDTISELPQKAVDYAKELPSKALDFAVDLPGNVVDYVLDPANIPTNILIGTQVAAGVQAKKELDAQKAEAERVLAEQEKYTREEVAFAKDVLRRYPVEYRRLSGEDVAAMNMAGGGLASLNAFKAGGRPRFLKGGGDGMSDDIPATIDGKQKAALSDGEFVIPADVVSHLGNGSSRAGAKKLYSMMDNIRKARTGKKRQAPEVKADRYMPA
jgi:hypothetical protein